MNLPQSQIEAIPTTMNPNASNFVPSTAVSNHLSVQPTGNLSSSTQNKSKKVSKRSPQQDLNLEYYKIELNTAQASIVVLESTINDLNANQTG